MRANKRELMSILNYLKPKSGLPDPIGPSSPCLLSQVIALANSEVAKATNNSNNKRGQYIHDVSLKHWLDLSKLFRTPPCFTVSISSQLRSFSLLGHYLLHMGSHQKLSLKFVRVGGHYHFTII